MKITFVEGMVAVAVDVVILGVTVGEIKYGFNHEDATGYNYTYISLQ